MTEQEDQFVTLIEKHQNIIHKVCRLYTDNITDHEDLFQEVLLQIWQAYTRYRGDSKLTTWMYRIALYTAMSRIKKNARHPQQMQINPEIVKEYADEPTPDYEELNHAINQLEDHEKALVLLYLDEHNYKEIAEIMGISENNVGVRLNRIKKKLKKIITP